MSGSQAAAPTAMSAPTPPSPSPDAPTPDDGAESGSQVVLTVTLGPDGTFTVYAGDEPDEGDEPPDATDAASPGGAAPVSDGGQEADTVGEALKLAMSILKAAQDGAGASPDAQFQAGFAGKPAP